MISSVCFEGFDFTSPWISRFSSRSLNLIALMMLIQFLCIVWKLSLKDKHDNFLVFPFHPPTPWSVSCMRKRNIKSLTPLFLNWLHVNVDVIFCGRRRDCLWFFRVNFFYRAVWKRKSRLGQKRFLSIQNVFFRHKRVSRFKMFREKNPTLINSKNDLKFKSICKQNKIQNSAFLRIIVKV
jgi:hypothetical protein